jgi:hypothetical protein
MHSFGAQCGLATRIIHQDGALLYPVSTNETDSSYYKYLLLSVSYVFLAIAGPIAAYYTGVNRSMRFTRYADFHYRV